MKSAFISLILTTILSTTGAIACEKPELEAAAILSLKAIESGTTLTNLKIGHRVIGNHDGSLDLVLAPAFQIAATFTTKKIDGERNKQDAVYLLTLDSTCAVKSESLIYIDKIINY